MDPTGSSTLWTGVVRPHADPGLATCLRERRLCREHTPVATSRLEVEALSLAEWAVARRETVVLCPADPLAPLSELIAAAVHVADMAAYYASTGHAAGSRRRVAVVSSDFHVRGLYRRLGVRNPRSASVATLREVVPAATLGRDGVVRVLGGDPSSGWATVFVSGVADLRKVQGFDMVVVDLPAPGAEELATLDVPVVMVARDPADETVLRLGDDALVFGWGEVDLARVAGDDGLPPRVARRAGGDGCEVVTVPGQAVCENAALFWQDVGPLLRACGRSVVGRQLSREAFSLFHDLVDLALPTAVYEASTAPIRVRLDAVAAATRLTRGDVRDLYLPSVALELRDLAAAIGADPPKREGLRRTLGPLVDQYRDVMLVVRTAELARLYAADLAGERNLADVRVTSLGALVDTMPADVAVLTGMAPSWARWVYRAGIAGSLRVLAYTPEGPVESVAAGFDESGMVRQAVADQRAREAWFARPEAKDRVWSRLSGEPRSVADAGDRSAPRGDATSVATRGVPPPEVPPGLWDGAGWLAPLEPASSGSGLDGAGSMARRSEATVRAVKVAFADGRWALLDAGGMVTRYRAGTGTSDAYPVSHVKLGDKLLFLDGDGHKDLLAKVLEVAAGVPALEVAAVWLGQWRRALVTGYRRFGTYDAFARALHDEGCQVQTQTIRLWVVGDIIGPSDDEDVRRVATVVEDSALLHGHGEVCRAIRSLRGAHVKLGRRLAELARHVGSAAAAGRVAADEVVDEASGLTAADFQDSVDIVTVTAVEDAGDVPSLLVGRLGEAEEETE